MCIIPLIMIPPIPSLPYLVFDSSFSISIFSVLSVKAIVDAMIAGSSACMFIDFGLDANVDLAFIIFS